MGYRLLGFLLVGCVTLGAIPSRSLAEADRPCREDIQRLCKDMKGGALVSCLHDHVDALSPACKARLTEVKNLVEERRAELKKFCKDDLEKYCKSVPGGPVRMMQCLREHKDQLSPECKTVVEKRPARPAGAAASGAAATPHSAPAGKPAP